MGILDSLFNGSLSPEQSQALLGAAAQVLQASGPSRTPTSFGQILGGGLQAYQQGINEAEQRKQQLASQALNSRLLGLKIQDAESDLANQQAQRERASKLAKFYEKDALSSAPSPDAVTSRAVSSLIDQVGNAAPTIDNASVLSNIRSMQSPQQQAVSGTPKQSLFESRLAQADRLRAAGFGPEADATEKNALAFMPKVKGWEKVQQNGQVMFAPFFEDGSSGAPVPLSVAEKLEKVDLGGTSQLVNPFTGQVITSTAKTATPGEQLTARTAANRLAFDKEQIGDNGTGPLTQQAIDNAAKRYNYDGTLPQMGMGKAAAAGRSVILNRAAELAGESGSTTGGREEQLSNKGNIASQNAAVRSFTSGKQGNTVRSFNTSIAHLDTLNSLADALNNGNIQAVNRIGNFYNQQTGNPAPTNFNAAKKIVGDEVVKAIVGSGGGVHDREEAAKTIDAANSPAQLQNVIKTYQELMVGQLAGLEQQYKSSTNRNDFQNLLSDRSREIYQQSHGVSQSPKTATLADIAETARSSGKSTAEVTARLKALGYKIGGE